MHWSLDALSPTVPHARQRGPSRSTYWDGRETAKWVRGQHGVPLEPSLEQSRAWRFPATGIDFRQLDVMWNPGPSLCGTCGGFGLGENATWQWFQSVRSLNPRPLRIRGTHFSARAARVFACFAPET